MKEITRENILSIRAELENKVVVLYGAGTSGRQAFQILNDLKIHVDFFVDDDPSKQGSIIEGLNCLSFDELKNKAENNEVSVILSSVFVKLILEKLKKIPVSVYELYAMLINECANVFDQCMSMNQDMASWDKKWNKLNEIFSDEESKNVWQLMNHVTKTRNVIKEEFIEISSLEEHYFVSPIPTLLNFNSVLIDCGAYTGDMLGQLLKNKIPFRKIYEIEANPITYKTIVNNASKLNLKDKVVAINCGLYDKNGEMNFFVSNENPAASYLQDHEINMKGGGAIIQNSY